MDGCAIHVNDDEEGTFSAWSAFPDLIDGKRKMKLNMFKSRQDCIWAYREWNRYYRSGKIDFFAKCNKQQLNEFIDWFAPHLPLLAEEFRSLNLDKLYINGIAFSNGILGAPSFQPLSDETWATFKRLAAVFDQAYIRFIDLQKAEEQTRKAQIEAALERVRSKALAMHNSSDLPSTASVVFTELRKLGIKTMRSGISIHNKENRKILLYTATNSKKGEELSVIGWATLDSHPILSQIYDSWLLGEDYFPELRGQLLKTYYEQIDPAFKVPKEQSETEQYGYFISFTHGTFYGWSKTSFEENARQILKRFASVVDLTFKRYFDLQKAETRAREAQIETALERVRSRSMAMHKSEELQEVAMVLFEQIKVLGIQAFASGFNIWDEDKKKVTQWMAAKNGFQPPFKTSTSEDVSLLFYEAEQRGETLYVLEQKGKELEDHYKYLIKNPMVKKAVEAGLVFPAYQITHCAFFSHGYLMFITYEPVLESHEIFKRFAKVFEQTYTRFLDLQKAEAQAREAQIETALEKVRSRSLAMHESYDLHGVVSEVFEQIEQLGIVANSAQIHEIIDDRTNMHFWHAANGQNYPKQTHIPIIENKFFTRFFESTRDSIDFFADNLSKDEKNLMFNHYFKNSSHKDIQKNRQKFILSTDGLNRSCVLFENTALTIMRYDTIPYSSDENELIRRFGFVFEQSYTRFLDLQKAEAQAREAQIEVALERV